ncbi:MAG: MraY family glycosyltransferase [bacterium]
MAIFCSFWMCLALALFIPIIRQSFGAHLRSWPGLILGSLVIIGIGAYDDCRHIQPGPKILFQGLAGSIIIASGFQIRLVSNPFGEGALSLGWLSLPLTFFWIVGITNALNMIDGLDGLAAGVTAIAGLTIFAIAHTNRNFMAAFLSLILVGNVLGFLVYNFNPASIFLGDSGSLFLGFWLSFLSIQGAQARAYPVLPIAVPLMVLGFPIMDMLWAVLRRLFQPGTDTTRLRDKILSIFKADQGHIHHRLLSRGFSHRLAVLLLYCLCLIFAGCALCIALMPWINQRIVALFLLASCLSVKNMTDLKTAGSPEKAPLPLAQESGSITIGERKR